MGVPSAMPRCLGSYGLSEWPAALQAEGDPPARGLAIVRAPLRLDAIICSFFFLQRLRAGTPGLRVTAGLVWVVMRMRHPILQLCWFGSDLAVTRCLYRP